MNSLQLSTVLKDAISKHPKTAWCVAVGAGTWLGLIAVFWFLGESVPQIRPWLELANGATWPNEWECMLREYRFRFAVTVGTRTALNFAGPLIVIGSGIWFFFVEARRIMNMSRLEQLRLLNAELVAAMISVVNNRHPEMKLDTKDRQAMLDEADEVAEQWLKAAEEHDKKHAE